MDNELLKNFIGKDESIIIAIIWEISVKSGSTVSWTRPIRRRDDIVEFKKLMVDLEQRGIVETSQPSWLNPVVWLERTPGS